MLIGNTQIETSLDNITKADLDAIVNSSNSQLYGQHGINGVIHKVAGKELKTACEKLGGCKPGEAKITDGYALPCKYIIHTVGPIWQDGLHDEGTILKSCYINLLKLASACGIRSIGFSSISTGKHGFPAKKAAFIALNTVAGFVREHPDTFDRLIWFLHKDETKQVYDEAMSLLNSVFKIKSEVQLQELPVYKIEFENSIVLLSTLKDIYDKDHIIPVKGVITVLDSEDSKKTCVIPAGFCTQDNTFYTGIQIMIKVLKSGIPLCRVIPETEKTILNEDKKFLKNTQVLLKQYGYRAKNLDHLTYVQRQTILAMLIERRIITADELIKHLDTLVQGGKNKPFYSTDAKNLGRWRSDRDFISLYDMVN